VLMLVVLMLVVLMLVVLMLVVLMLVVLMLVALAPAGHCAPLRRAFAVFEPAAAPRFGDRGGG